MTAFPWFVSYLEVPLFSPLGYLLGSYCVVDDRLHEYDNDETVGIMNDIADAIMDHLENKRIKQSRHRAEQLVDGLSKFIAAEPVETSQAQGSALPGAGLNAGPQDMGPFQDTRPSPRNRGSSSSADSSVSAPSFPGLGGDDDTPLTSLGSLAEEEYGENPLEQGMTAQNTPDSVESPTSSPLSLTGTGTPEIHASGFISSANIKSAFYRAASTIRESMSMDGLVFLDAVPSSFIGRSTHKFGTGQADDAAAGPFCAEIVHSRVDQAAHASPTSPPPARLPESILQRFIGKYPRGHLFSADVFGPIDESYSPGQRFPGLHPDEADQQLRQDVLALFRMLPAARYIIFLPMWHFQRECWYAAALCWVVEPTHALDASDVSLVAAFGNSVMAEVSRMETMAASRAKSSFVSSISHELRSPLHGILASSELLRESISDSSLLSTLDMLDSCGETLLDTFNNLLDHAIAIKDGTGSHASVKKLQTADLAVLVEEVVEAVHFSHLAEKAFQTSLQRRGGYSAHAAGHGTAQGNRPLLVMLNIAPVASWDLAVDVGAWKRIVMNIFGNALKYTHAGRIEVGLRIEQKPDREGHVRDHICFTVEDTGRGMSSDYLKYRLFTPFSQEDNYSPGIGLGLSIIQQLTRGLGGSVDVKSSVGIGTLVEVCFPMEQAQPSAPSPAPSPAPEPFVDMTMTNAEIAKRTACIISAEALAAAIKIDLRPVSIEKRERAAIVERAIRTNAAQSLGIHVTIATPQQPVPKADVYVVDAEVYQEVLEASAAADVIHETFSPLVVLCSGGGPPKCSEPLTPTRKTIHLHHPVGPRKLSTVVSSMLKSRAPEEPNPGLASEDQTTPTALQTAGGPLPPRPALHKRDLRAIAAAPHRSVTWPQETNPPAHPPVAETQPPPLTITIPGPLEKYLLLVDDNPINIKLLVAVVRKLKHPYATAANGLEAVNLFRQAVEQGRRFDMVFMDISMPVMDGFEAIREIRRLESEAPPPSHKRARIAALTGLSSEFSRKEVVSSGGDAFLTKPIKLDTVRRLLDDLVGDR